MTNGNEPAYPRPAEGTVSYPGLTKREWFAGMVVKGFLSGTFQATLNGKSIRLDLAIEHHRNALAKQSFQLSDAMLKEANQ